jgi:uncharacterized SAM-binding protein YcdF (DUF218 family)
MLKTVLVLLLMPPVNLALFALAGLALARVWPRIGRAISLGSVIGLLLLSLHAVTTPMLAALERDLPLIPPADHPPAAIVVLSGDGLRDAGSPSGYTVGSLTLMRLRTAAELHRRTGLPIMVSGGQMAREAPTLAALMAHVLREDFRIEVRWQEDRSRDTWENARFSNQMLRAEGIRSIYVVTHAWHMRRTLLSFAPTGLTLTAAPTPLLRRDGWVVTDFIPTVSSWLTAYFAAHEWVGLAWYAAR